MDGLSIHSGDQGPMPGDGPPDAGSMESRALLPQVYAQLRALAELRIQSVSPGASLRPTELVHEAYMRLTQPRDRTWESRRHFVGTAAMAMRSVLLDRARARTALKRSGGRTPVPLGDVELLPEHRTEDVLEVEEALAKLETLDPRSGRVVVLRFYLGLTEAEIAEALGVTDRTVRRDWTFARMWLQRELARAKREREAEDEKRT